MLAPHFNMQTSNPQTCDVPSCHLPAAENAVYRVAGHQHGPKLAQHNKSHIQASRGREGRAVFLLSCCGGGWVCSWAARNPGAVGCTMGNLLTAAGMESEQHATQVACGKLEAMALCEGGVGEVE